MEIFKRPYCVECCKHIWFWQLMIVEVKDTFGEMGKFPFHEKCWEQSQPNAPSGSPTTKASDSRADKDGEAKAEHEVGKCPSEDKYPQTWKENAWCESCDRKQCQECLLKPTHFTENENAGVTLNGDMVMVCRYKTLEEKPSCLYCSGLDECVRDGVVTVGRPGVVYPNPKQPSYSAASPSSEIGKGSQDSEGE